MKISTIIPSYRRPDLLRRCIAGLCAQSRSAEDAVFVVRDDDLSSAKVVVEVNPSAHLASVRQSGVIAAMNAGLARATGDIIALTDDDAAPWPDWLKRIEVHFASDPKLGVVGGKDWQYKGDPLRLDEGTETRAGHMQWHGRIIGQHHWAIPGPPREVAVVKGVNIAFRASALRAVGGFDTRLAGTGAQVHWELSVCLAIKRAGWKVVFDPALGVDHFPATRFDEDQRGQFASVAQSNMVANETLILVEHFRSVQRIAFLLWAFFVGTRASPGLVQIPRLLVQRDRNTAHRWFATVRGRVQGIMAYRRWLRDSRRATPSSASHSTLHRV